ncbi:MAG TPA: winged helix-turn-helix transcriptional regulator [Thermoplasmatales archaeon]|nr:winged helix-turn-helix transcriptional regulator [Thermoplasmatales archaeon]
MSKMKEILSIISKENAVNLQALSKKLGFSIPTLRAIIESMVHQGYLEEVGCESNCGICPIKCNSKIPKIKMYRLTEKGMRYIGRDEDARKDS